MPEQVTAEYLRSLPTEKLTAFIKKRLWTEFLLRAPAEIRAFGQRWGISEEKVEETIQDIQRLEG